MRYYVASKLENLGRVVALQDALDALGWTCTYKWTAHGSVRGDHLSGEAGAAILTGVCERELAGVLSADVVIFFLPGGRGAHCELGAALAAGKRVIAWLPADADRALFGLGEATTVFYFHPLVERFIEMTPGADVAGIASAIARAVASHETRPHG